MRAYPWIFLVMLTALGGSSSVMGWMASGETCTPELGCSEPGQSCRQEPGVCEPDAPGTCMARPAFCPAIYDPVCGCDGETYDNACSAYASGVNIDSASACGSSTTVVATKGVLLCHISPQRPDDRRPKLVGKKAVAAHLAHGDLVGPCPGMSLVEGTLVRGAECVLLETDSGFPYVLENLRGYKPGRQVSAAGIWTANCPDICSEGFACLLRNTIKPRGESCTPELGCAETDQTCLQSVGNCAIDQPGVCLGLPRSCKRIDNPVCGCNFVRYDNPCLATLAGVSVYSMGACPGEPCVPSIGCPEGQYCMQEVGLCNPDAPGICQEPPEVCAANYDPVCGCDGETYGNGCTADAAGMNIDYSGMCLPN